MKLNFPENIGPQIGCIVYCAKGKAGAFAIHHIAEARNRGNIVVLRNGFATIHSRI